jgi:hypothetical protein
MTVGGFFKLIGNALLAGIFCGIFLPIAVFVIVMIVSNLASACGPGDSGGCAMGAAGIAIAASPFAAGIGFALGVYAGWKSA